ACSAWIPQHGRDTGPPPWLRDARWVRADLFRSGTTRNVSNRRTADRAKSQIRPGGAWAAARARIGLSHRRGSNKAAASEKAAGRVEHLELGKPPKKEGDNNLPSNDRTAPHAQRGVITKSVGGTRVAQ